MKTFDIRATYVPSPIDAARLDAQDVRISVTAALETIFESERLTDVMVVMREGSGTAADARARRAQED